MVDQILAIVITVGGVIFTIWAIASDKKKYIITPRKK